MLTKSIHRKAGQVLAVLAAVTTLSGLAEAQQSGMFPLQSIRRERTPCANEEPIYKLYRNQYYGYFPTQWRKFPEGWSLRTSETPNTAEELKKNPIESPKPFSPDGQDDEMQGPAGVGAKPPIPNPPPDERSPFDLDRPDSGAGAAPGAGAPARRTPPARGNTPTPAPDASPFDIPESNPPGAGATPGDRPQASRSNRAVTPTTPDQGAPDLAPPGEAPAAPPRTSWNRRRDSRQEDPGPLLSMTDATLPSVEEATSSAAPSTGTIAETTANNTSAPDPATTPAAAQPQPAPKRGPISSFFAGLGQNWLRR